MIDEEEDELEESENQEEDFDDEEDLVEEKNKKENQKKQETQKSVSEDSQQSIKTQIIEREINLSLLNDKLNYIIQIISK
jgi:hypothetical protein